MLKQLLLAGIVTAALTGVASAQEVITLKIHQPIPPQATIPAKFIKPWADKVTAESGGRLVFEIYPAMQLGGAPPALIDQVRDGFVDMIWTLPGYTPGRFPKTEVFELPFFTTTAEPTSRALQQFYAEELVDEFESQGIHIIAMHVHSPGLIHSKVPINKLEDMKGLNLRGPTRVINLLLAELGATAVGMPVPAVPEALSKGAIDGAVVPWEVTPSLKLSELVTNHTSFSGDRGFYVATFIFAMNKARYDSLPEDLRKVIDDNSGVFAADWAGKAMDAGDAPGLKIAQDRGNNIIVLDAAETERWRQAAEPVYAKWLAEMTEKGIDGQALIDKARALIDKESAM